MTISGPPPTLDLLCSTDETLASTKNTPLRVSAAFHAAHLECPDLDRILGKANLASFKLRPNVNLITVQGEVDPHKSDLRTVLAMLLRGCFQSTMLLTPETEPSRANAAGQIGRITSVEPCGSLESVRAWLDRDGQVDHVTAGAELFATTAAPIASDDIAIVGMAGRFPQADSLDEFWDIIVSGKDVHEFVSLSIHRLWSSLTLAKIPGDRFDANACFDKSASARNSTASPYGCFMKSPGSFDNVFFNLSPREARQIDPQQRLLLMVTQEALQMAGYSSAGDKRIGTFFGQATDDWRESHTRQNIDIFYVGAGMRAFAPGRLNYHYKWEGPSYSVDTACSSSLAALEFAFKAVQSGDCDIAVAGGGNLCSALPMFSGLSKGKFTSSSGACKTFDASADGYCRGEAVGVVIIKRMEDAMREKDNIKGTVSGIVTNHSAHAVSITHPHSGTQESLMLQTLDQARMDPSDVDYVEFHGTGTQAGDIAEITSVSTVFGSGEARSSPLSIGAVKANVGHGEAAAGITSLIKALLMLQHNTIPPHAGIKTELNPKLKQIMSDDLVIPTHATRFEDTERPKNIMINNFNATGGNTSMILTGPSKVTTTKPEDARTHHPIAVSAQTATSLRQNLQDLEEYLALHAHTNICDISYSTTARRTHHKIRHAFTAPDLPSLVESIKSAKGDMRSASPAKPRIAFVFAGQGTQSQGIARELFQTSPAFRQSLRDYETLSVKLGYPPFVAFLTKAEGKQEWTTVQLQLATVAIELALARLWQSWGVEPSFVMGHSIGEYTALCVAGVLSTADLFSLVGKRAQLMESLCEADTHTMLAAQQTADDLESLRNSDQFEGCEISCFNSPKATTISGPRTSLAKVKDELSAKDVRAKFLSVKYAFHSTNIEPILDEYEAFARAIPFYEPEVPVISTLLGREVIEPGVFSARYLAEQCRRPVDFVGALHACTSPDGQDVEEGTVWIEFGPGDPMCLPLVKSTVAAKHRAQLLTTLSTRISVWETTSDSLAKCYENSIEVDWKAYHADHEASLSLLDMPQYAFDLQNFWIPLEQTATSAESAPRKEKISSLLHTVENVTNDKDGLSAEFQSTLSDPYLFHAIHGHFVLETPLCPSSVYSALAMKAVSYLESQATPATPSSDHKMTRELGQMEIKRPLIVHEDTHLQLKVSVSQPAGSNEIAVAFASFGKGHDTTEHGSCSLWKSDSAVWKSDWSKVEFLVNARMESLETSKSASIMRLPKAVLYKLFAHVVNYDEPFRGLQQITLDNENNEAIADVHFDAIDDADPDYDLHMIDSLMHFAGFVLNNGIDDEDHAFISDGWESLRMPAGLKRTENYRYYVRLAADEKNQTYTGDVYAFAGPHIIACCNGVRFQRMKTQSLRTILGRQNQHRRSSADKGEARSEKQSDRPRVDRVVSSPVDDKASEMDTFAKLKRIVAEEVGVEESKVTDGSGLQQLGLDSILMTSVLDKISQVIGITVPSSEASAAEDFGALKKVVAAHDEATYSESASTAVEQPADHVSASREASASPAPTAEGPEVLLDVLINAIADSAGVARDQVEQTSEFSQLGVDSLLGLDIIDSVQRQTGRELPSSILHDNPNVERLRRALANRGSAAISRSPRSGSASPRKSTNFSYASPRRTSLALSQVAKDPRQLSASPKPAHKSQDFSGCETVKTKLGEAKVILVQGSSNSKAAPLFMLPPGSGNTAVYTGFSKDPGETPMYALASAYASSPLHDQHTFDNMVQAYKAAIVKTYPSGPYNIGGFSIGGGYAYEIARQLLTDGKTVASLTIIDCPAPEPPQDGRPDIGLDALTMAGYMDHMTTVYPNFPRSLQEHMARSTRAFNDYDPQPLGTAKPGRTTVIWATRGDQRKLISSSIVEQKLLDEAAPADRAALIEKRRATADRSCFGEPRTEFGANGWEKLLGDEVEYLVMEGDHNSIISGSNRAVLAGHVFEALRKGEAKTQRRRGRLDGALG